MDLTVGTKRRKGSVLSETSDEMRLSGGGGSGSGIGGAVGGAESDNSEENNVR